MMMPLRNKRHSNCPRTRLFVMKAKDMPWLALAGDDASHANITTKYGNALMPTLVLLDENDEVVARSNEGEKNLGTRAVFKKYLELTKVPKKK